MTKKSAVALREIVARYAVCHVRYKFTSDNLKSVAGQD